MTSSGRLQRSRTRQEGGISQWPAWIDLGDGPRILSNLTGVADPGRVVSMPLFEPLP